MKKITLVLFLCFVFLAACEQEPTLVPSTPFFDTAPSPMPGPVLKPAPSATASSETRILTAPTAAAPSATTPREPGGSIVIAGIGAPTREITALPEFISRALYDSLLRVDPKTGDLIPGLAERWLVSEDAKTFVFVLRENVKWHDGTPLTADDVVFTLETLSSPSIRLNPAADFGQIEKISATDARTVSVTLREPYCAALTYIGAVNILPQHVLSGKPLTNVADADLVGTGPLILVRWQDDTAVLTRNPNYWNGAPQILNWTYQTYPDERAANDAVRQKRANLLVSNSIVDGAASTPFSANEFYALALNTQREPFDDSGVRQAIGSALDKTELSSSFGATLETSLLPAYWAFPSNLAPQKFDAARARQLLADAGWRDADGDGIVEKDGKPFEVTLWAQAEEPRSEISAQLLRQQLARVGVRAVLKLTERTLFLTRVFLREYDLALVHFNIPLDPDQHYFWASEEDESGAGLNVTGYLNARVQDALNAGNGLARCEPNTRKTAYAPVFQQLAQDVPMVFLYAPTRVLNANASWRGIAPSSFAGAFWNLNAWRVEP